METPIPTNRNEGENLRAAQLEVKEAKFATEPPEQPHKRETEPARPSEEPTTPEQAPAVPRGETESGKARREPELPKKYGTDRVAIISRDPDWLFAYWEITPQGRDAARREMESVGGGESGASKTALRVYDITGVEFTGRNVRQHIDIEISDDIGNWYVNTGEPGRTFLIDVGLLGSGGTFHTIARSNAVTMPRATASDETEERWMTTRGEFDLIYALSGGHEVARAAPSSLFSPGA